VRYSSLRQAGQQPSEATQVDRHNCRLMPASLKHHINIPINPRIHKHRWGIECGSVGECLVKIRIAESIAVVLYERVLVFRVDDEPRRIMRADHIVGYKGNGDSGVAFDHSNPITVAGLMMNVLPSELLAQRSVNRLLEDVSHGEEESRRADIACIKLNCSGLNHSRDMFTQEPTRQASCESI